MIHYIDGSQITEEVLKNNDKLVIIEFSADWSVPCKEQLDVLVGVEKKYYPDVEIYKVDIEGNKGISVRYNVNTTPTIIFFKDGEEIERSEGLIRLESLEKLIEEMIV